MPATDHRYDPESVVPADRTRRYPRVPADLARYGQPAYDLAKACALTIVQAAYQLAKSEADIAALAELTEAIHRACAPPAPIDFGESSASMCTDPVVRRGSLENAADLLARALSRTVRACQSKPGTGLARSS